MTYGACEKHPNFPLTNCPECKRELREISLGLSTDIAKGLSGTQPSQQDKSVMIKLTPQEIKNLMKMMAEMWKNATEAKTSYTIDQLVDFHYDLSFDILEKTDPDRFINQS
jgi:hypothetical protein